MANGKFNIIRERAKIAVVKIFYNILQRLKTNQANICICEWVCVYGRGCVGVVGWSGGVPFLGQSPNHRCCCLKVKHENSNIARVVWKLQVVYLHCLAVKAKSEKRSQSNVYIYIYLAYIVHIGCVIRGHQLPDWKCLSLVNLEKYEGFVSVYIWGNAMLLFIFYFPPLSLW